MGAAGRRCDRAADVAVEVEAGVLDPQRVVDTERHRHQPPAERGQQVQALGQRLLHALERVPTGGGGRIEHRDLQRVHVQRRRLHVEEAGVEAGEPLHGHPAATPAASPDASRAPRTNLSTSFDHMNPTWLPSYQSTSGRSQCSHRRWA